MDALPIEDLFEEDQELPDDLHFEEFIEKVKKKGVVNTEEDTDLDIPIKKKELHDFEDFDETSFSTEFDDDFEDFDEEDSEDNDHTPKKREKGLQKLPVDRNQDRRRL